MNRLERATAFCKWRQAQEILMAKAIGAEMELTEEQQAQAQLDAIGDAPVTMLTEELWQVNVKVQAGQKVIYNEKRYLCLQSHITATQWHPESGAVSLWQIDGEKQTEDINGETYYVFAPRISAVIGDKCIYEGKIYECLQNHITATYWPPDAAHSLWKQVSE